MDTAKTYKDKGMILFRCDICGNPRVTSGISPTVAICHMCNYAPLFSSLNVRMTDVYYALCVKWSIR